MKIFLIVVQFVKLLPMLENFPIYLRNFEIFDEPIRYHLARSHFVTAILVGHVVDSRYCFFVIIFVNDKENNEGYEERNTWEKTEGELSQEFRRGKANL